MGVQSWSWFGAVLAAAVLAGCATAPQTSPVGREVLGRTSDFVVLRVAQRTSYRSLAKEYLGDADAASVVAAANDGDGGVQKGGVAVVPLRPRNAAHVYTDGYQTVPILCYHRFANERSDDPLVVAAADFRAQLEYLRDNGYNVISLQRFESFLGGGAVLPEKAVVLTIDDGYRSVMEIAYPLLREFGYPATLFVYPDFIGGGHALSWGQLKTLQDTGVIDIQSHSKTHTSHSADPSEAKAAYEARIDEEVSVSKRALQRRVGVAMGHYAYPYGDTSPLVAQLLQRSGVSLAATVQRGANASFAPPLWLKRDMVYGRDSLGTFARRLRVYQKADLK